MKIQTPKILTATAYWVTDVENSDCRHSVSISNGAGTAAPRIKISIAKCILKLYADDNCISHSSDTIDTIRNFLTNNIIVFMNWFKQKLFESQY